MKRVNDAIQDFMMVCAKHTLNSTEILAACSLLVAQQLAMHHNPIWTARWIRMMKEKKKEIIKHIKQEKKSVH